MMTDEVQAVEEPTSRDESEVASKYVRPDDGSDFSGAYDEYLLRPRYEMYLDNRAKEKAK